MKWLRRIVVLALALAALWLGALVVLGFALDGRTRRATADRLAESLQGAATIDGGDLALVRGSLALDELRVRRDDVLGKLELHVASVRCDLPPLGGALFDRECRDLVVRGTQLDASSLALFHARRPKRPPLHARHVVIDDATLSVAATSLAPDLGKVAVHIEHAEAGATVFKTPLSFLFALRALHATIDLPGNGKLDLRYDAGELVLAGSLFGAEPIALPIALPVAELADDAGAEVAKLVAFGREIGERLLARRATDWLKEKLPLP
ncbi:MAG TPA: hypothetical protein VFP84_19035 [Kofleriaceae bacterium]|nr:hypothetical protein [Kofleriaceae bacterium]